MVDRASRKAIPPSTPPTIGPISFEPDPELDGDMLAEGALVGGLLVGVDATGVGAVLDDMVAAVCGGYTCAPATVAAMTAGVLVGVPLDSGIAGKGQQISEHGY